MKQIHKEQFKDYLFLIYKDVNSFDLSVIDCKNNYKAYTLLTKEMALQKMAELKEQYNK